MTQTLTHHPVKLIAPLKYFGAKYYLARRHLALVPRDTEVCTDLYGCTGVVALNAPAFLYQHYNELDFFKFIVLKTIKFHGKALRDCLLEVKYSEETFEKYKEINQKHVDYPEPHKLDPIMVSMAMLIRNRMSRGADGETYGWSDRLRRNMPEYISAWGSMINAMPMTAKRLQTINLHNYPALTFMKTLFNSQKKFTYMDPPYPHDIRVTDDNYGPFEMKPEQHMELLSACRAEDPTRHRIMLCSYPNPMYDTELKDWRRIDFDIASSSGQTKKKKRKIDSIYLNYTPEAA